MRARVFSSGQRNLFHFDIYKTVSYPPFFLFLFSVHRVHIWLTMQSFMYDICFFLSLSLFFSYSIISTPYLISYNVFMLIACTMFPAFSCDFKIFIVSDNSSFISIPLFCYFSPTIQHRVQKCRCCQIIRVNWLTGQQEEYNPWGKQGSYQLVRWENLSKDIDIYSVLHVNFS